MKKTTKN